MEMIRCLMPLFLSIIEMVLNNSTGKMNFPEFQNNLKAKLDEVGREITRFTLEEIDKEIREDKQKRRGWEICRKKDPKEVVTNFGVVRYERTYYRHKKSGRYAYLVDEEVGYTPHMRVDRNVKAKLVERAGDMAYRKAAAEASSECGGVVLSGQTVLKAVRQFKWTGLPQEARKQVPVLYIEADEDHIGSQEGREMEVRLVYIHEGWEEDSGRRELKNPVYLSSVAEEAEEFWERIWEEADARYELEGIKEIYIIGDGASWIRSALKVFPKAKFILDKFHLMKYVRRAVGGAGKKGEALRAALRFGNKEKAAEVIKELLEAADTASRRKAIFESWRYIENNWEAVKELYRQKGVTCSVEGHISHVLSARMSSRPMGWSYEGAKHMAQIRVCQANGRSVAKEYLKQCCKKQEELPVLRISEEIIEKQRKKLKAAREVLDNIPVFKGPKSFLYEALKGLSLAVAE